MNEPASRPDRREFLRWAGRSVAAFHAWALCPSAFSGPRPAMPTDEPLSLRHVHLSTADVEKTLAFYERALGLSVERTPQGGTVAIGASRLSFRTDREAPQSHYHVAFNIPENKLDRAIEWAAPRFDVLTNPRSGTPVVDFDHWNAHSVFFVDDAGNLLEFIARHELANARKGAFGPGDLLNVSEIGVVVDDVPKTARWLHAQLGVRHYAEPPNEHFCAVGDANGLFIVVPPGRRGRFEGAWAGFDGAYPTEIEVAGARPATIEVPGYPYRIRVV